MDKKPNPEELIKQFSFTARDAFSWLLNELTSLARKTYVSSQGDEVWLESNLEDILKSWIVRGGISLTPCVDLNSILSRLNRLAGEHLAETNRGSWRLERFPPTSHLFEEGVVVDLDYQYALLRSLHEVLDQFEKKSPRKACALEMYFWGGFGYVEIGESLNVNQKTVWDWVREGLTFVKKKLSARA